MRIDMVELLKVVDRERQLKELKKTRGRCTSRKNC